MTKRIFMKIDTNSKELARLDIRILCHLNELKRLRSTYKKMRHRSIHRLTALCRSRKRILVRIQEAAAAEKQSRGPIVNILPVEILAEIFCLVEDTAYDSLEVQYSTPWVLGRVCHHWRIIVNSTPKLWANVSVEHADEREWTDGRLCLLREMLSRSRSYPLQVAYTASWDDYPYMLSELQPHAHHLSSLELATKCPHFLNPLAFYDFADTQLPLLESLTINVEGSVFGTYDHTTIRNEVTICPENIWAV